MFYIYLDVSTDISSFYQISQHTNAKLRIVIITSFSVTSMIESSKMAFKIFVIDHI